MQFPEIKFSKSNNAYKQFMHLRSEVMEVQVALNELRMVADDVKSSYAEKAIEECLDTIHSAETLIRVIQREYPGIDLDGLHRALRNPQKCGERLL